MINWFDMPAEGLSNGGLFEVKELEVTENGTYETKGEMYNKVTVNVGGGGGSNDFSTAKVTFICPSEPEINFAFINVQNDGIYSLLNITESTQTVTVPLYKNKLSCSIPRFNMSITSTSGSITGTQKNGYIISGDCTINYTLPN